MNRKPPLTCCCPQHQQISGGGFHNLPCPPASSGKPE